jgi:hypothetical protein
VVAKTLDKFKFAVLAHDSNTNTGLFSSVLGVSVGLAGDIYLHERSSGGVIKASFHRDGRGHIAVSSEFHRHRSLPNQARFIQKWEIPEGYSLPAFRILIPWSELRSGASPFAGHPETVLVASGPAEHVVEITLHFMSGQGERPNATHYDVNDAGSGPLRFLMTASMSNGRNAILLVRTYESPPGATAMVHEIRTAVLREGIVEAPRAVVYTRSSDGVPGCVDLALDEMSDQPGVQLRKRI